MSIKQLEAPEDELDGELDDEVEEPIQQESKYRYQTYRVERCDLSDDVGGDWGACSAQRVFANPIEYRGGPRSYYMNCDDGLDDGVRAYEDRFDGLE